MCMIFYRIPLTQSKLWKYSSWCLIFSLGIQPVTLNGSVSSANFTLISNVSVSVDVSLRVRTRQSSAVLIEIRSDSSRFFKMELTNGRVRVTFALEGESGLIMSGRLIGVNIITEIPIEKSVQLDLTRNVLYFFNNPSQGFE